MKKKIIDLTYTIEEDMPVYPGTARPEFLPAGMYETDGFRETRLSMCSHNGTHMDAPAHIFADGRTLDELSVQQFIGSALVIDCRDAESDSEISMDRINRVRDMAEQAEYLLFLTGWSRFWTKASYFEGYPVIGEQVCRYIIESGKKGIGLDTVSVDPVSDSYLTRHRMLLRNEIVIVENLKNLELLGENLFTFAAFPMKFQNSDGAPVRAVGIL